MQISAKRVISKVGKFEDKLFTVEAVLPRIVLAELNTHKMLSKNSASSRAIPFDKMLKAVEDNPFIPIAWQQEHPGMQGKEYYEGFMAENLNDTWFYACNKAIESAKRIDDLQATKQLANRVLEAYMYHKVVITGTEWDNFFNLRCPQYSFAFKTDEINPNTRGPKYNEVIFKSWKEAMDYGKMPIGEVPRYSNFNTLEKLKVNKGMAEIHMMALAEAIYDEYQNCEDTKSIDGWNLPYVTGDKSLETEILDLTVLNHPVIDLVKISTARCARTSYTTPDVAIGESAFDADMKLHDRLLHNSPPHSSPAEHPAYEMTSDEYFDFQKVYVVGSLTERIENDVKLGKTSVHKIKYGYKVTEFGWCNNLRGFIPYRFIVDNGGKL